jgi:hybrid polyketide synthase / nonribosomal peptide synthetase ACE1
MLCYLDLILQHEAHGTGTPVGEPKEAEAIYKIVTTGACSVPDSAGPLDAWNMIYAGSIKTALGHTEGAAGVAALLKASLAIQKR